MAKNEINIVVSVKNLASKGLNAARTSLSALNRTAKATVNTFKGFLKIGGFISAGLSLIGGKALKNAAAFEAQQVAFETMLGSAEDAQKLLKQIEEFSASTPFQLPGLIEGSKKLLAFGVSAEEVVSTMSRLGDLSQGNQETLDRLTDAFGKLRAKGKASLEEINRFTEAGVPLVDELAKNFGLTTQEVLKLVSKGEVGFQDVEKAVTSLTSEGGKFFELTKKQSETLGGLFSTTKDNIGLILKDFGSKLLPQAKEVLKTLIDALGGFRGDLPKFILGIEKFFIDVKTMVKINAEIIKEVMAKPFSFETYKVIFEEFIHRVTTIRAALINILSGGINELRKIIARVREEEKKDNKTLQEEIELLRQEGNARKLELEQQYQDSLKETMSQEVKNAKKVIAEKQKLEQQEIIRKKKELDLKKKEEIKLRKQEEDEKKKAAEKEISDRESLNRTLVNLSRSKNRELSAIGKAASIFNIGIESKKAAVSAYSALAGIPFVGPGLGAAAGLAALAFGAEQAAGVKKSTPRFQEGGIVPGSRPSGDNMLVRANSGEAILTKTQQRELLDLANGREQSAISESKQVNLIVDGKELAQTFVDLYNNNRSLDAVTKLTGE